jgi:hypothetical protein
LQRNPPRTAQTVPGGFLFFEDIVQNLTWFYNLKHYPYPDGQIDHQSNKNVRK